MPIAKILASITGGPHDAAILGYALAAARPFNAHVVAAFSKPDISDAIAFFHDGISGAVVDEVVRASREAAEEALRRARAALKDVTEKGGVKIVEKPVRSHMVTLSFRELRGNFADQVTEAARLSDIVVFGPLREDDRTGLAEVFVQVLTQTDRPVLLTTETAPEKFACRVAIGWDGKTAAAQAVSASIPYLARAEKVEVLSVQRSSAQPYPTEGLREYLALHGIEINERVLAPTSKSIGEVLLEAATEGGADLLVIGGYGHSRLRESLIGGVTRHVVSHATMPVFMVH
ncbi:MAG: universal stress protein [Proteobacteria bacterium]|nr:universal stress protein [Pseudomonadota bacterium]